MRRAYALIYPLIELRAVREPGQHVVTGDIDESFVLFHNLEREPDVPRELLEQPHFLLVETAGFRRVKCDHPGGDLVHNERQHG